MFVIERFVIPAVAYVNNAVWHNSGGCFLFPDTCADRSDQNEKWPKAIL